MVKVKLCGLLLIARMCVMMELVEEIEVRLLIFSTRIITKGE